VSVLSRFAGPTRRSGSSPWGLWMAGGVALVLLSLPWGLPNAAPGFSDFMAAWMPLSTVNQCVIWATFAIGLNIVVGYAGLLDLGYVGLLGFRWLFRRMVHVAVLHQGEDQRVRQCPGRSGAGNSPETSGWCCDRRPDLRLCGCQSSAPRRCGSKSDYLALVTMAFGEIIPELARNNPGGITNGDKGITPIDPIPLGPLSLIHGVPKVLGPFDLTYKFIVYAFILAIAIFISLRLRDGRLGRAWLAIREDEAGRQHDGRAADADQAGVVCRRGLHRWVGWRGLCDPHQSGGFGRLRLLGVHQSPGDGRAGRDGQCLGGAGGRSCPVLDNSNGLQQTGTSINNTFGTDIDSRRTTS